MNYIETGEITSLHGIRGEVKVYPWADYPEFLEEFDTFYIKKNKMHFQRLKAVSVRTHKGMVLIQFEGIDNTELARNLIGQVIYLNRDEIELEEGFYFIADLIGCKVVNGETGEEIGTYDPTKEPAMVSIDAEKAKAWIANGAQPTDTVKVLLKKNNII